MRVSRTAEQKQFISELIKLGFKPNWRAKYEGASFEKDDVIVYERHVWGYTWRGKKTTSVMEYRLFYNDEFVGQYYLPEKYLSEFMEDMNRLGKTDIIKQQGVGNARPE